MFRTGSATQETSPHGTQRARLLIEGDAQLSARDAIHVAVILRRAIRVVMSFNHGFDGLPGLIHMGG